MWIIKRADGFKNEEAQGAHEYLASVHRTLFLYGPIYGLPQRVDAFNASYIADSIWAMGKHDPSKPIKLVIDSEGGSVQDGMSIYDAMKLSQCEVWTFGRMCYSMAAVLLSAGTKDHRFVFPNSSVMLHNPAGMAQGDVEDVKIVTKELTRVKDLLVDRLIENGVRHPRKKVIKDIDRDFFLTAQEAIDYGIADRIVTGTELY